MIIELLFTAVYGIFYGLFGLLPSVPSFPSSLINSVNSFFNIIFNNLSLLDLFIHINTIKIAVPLIIVIINLDNIYSVIMWVIKKIPMINIK